MTNRPLVVAVASLSLTISASASAAFVTFSDRDEWLTKATESGAAVNLTEDFDDASVFPADVDYGNAAGVSAGFFALE
jgi:hypothetical protein